MENLGGYWVHNNAWNSGPGMSQTIRACSEKSWNVEASGMTGEDVKSYPNAHHDIDYPDGRHLSTWSTITSRFAGAGPGKGSYNVAYDLWLNGIGWADGHTEVMVWTETHGGATPLGRVVATYTAPDGKAYDVWKYGSPAEMNVVSFVSKDPQYAGTLDLKDLIDWAVASGYVPADPTVNQIDYGIEFRDTAGTSRFTASDFAVTMR
ncbi:hypothetical protein JHE00_04580 [Prauserella sp. ASG 168]|uniref:Glycosyl hydrolase family 12 n=2 Tax=Prauserella cavernicola TaxID=2800127 RepID=A0A934QQF4_9PSEU|nr:hypothetical protein [Prauserella cavernicola]